MDVQRFASSGRTPHFAAPVHTFIRARKGWLLSRGERTLGGVGVLSYDIRKRPWSLIWCATNRLNPTLIQRCGQPDALHVLTDNSQEAVLHSKVVFTGMTICLTMSPSDQCSQNPCQLRITLDVILACQTIYLSSNDVLSWVHRGTRME